MRELRWHLRCIAALLSSYLLGSTAFILLLGLLNRLLGRPIAMVFLFYPASQSYADAVCYRWHQRRFSWQPGLIGIFRQSGRIGLSFGIPNVEAQIKEDINAQNVILLQQRLEKIRRRLGADHKSFAGILPSTFARLGKEDSHVVRQRYLTARAVLAALDKVIELHALGPAVEVLVLGGRGYIAGEVLRLAAGRSVTAVDIGEFARFEAFVAARRGLPLIVVNLSRSGALADYLGHFWPGVIVLNEVYPEPSREELDRLSRNGVTCHHIAGVPGSSWPPFPRAYRGGIPCCAALPLGTGDQVAVVLAHLCGPIPAALASSSS